MTAPTIAVTCAANDQNGNPVAGAVFTARLDSTEVYQGFVVPERVQAVANATGIAVLNLWPNALGVAGSLYRVTAVNPDTGRKFLDTTISVPNSPCNLHEILVQAPYPTLDAAAQALVAAQGALAPVTAQAQIAADRAGEALAYRNTTKGYHDTVVGFGPDITAIAADLLQVNAVAADLVRIGAVADAISAVGAVATNVASVVQVGTAVANVNTVAGALAAVNTTAASIASVNAVASNIANVNAVAANAANINAAGAHASTAEIKAGEAADSAALFPTLFAQMATSLINTQTIVVAHHAFA